MNEIVLHDENDIKKLEKRVYELERNMRRCKELADNYQRMYEQLMDKFKVMNDRQNNIQAVYDYMTQVGSTLVRKKASSHTYLNPLNALEEKDKQLEHINTVKD